MQINANACGGPLKAVRTEWCRLQAAAGADTNTDKVPGRPRPRGRYNGQDKVIRVADCNVGIDIS